MLRNLIISGLAASALVASAHAQESTQENNGFSSWLATFKTEAVAAGISEDVFDNAFIGVTVDESVYKANDNQPEFNRAIWSYLDSAVSASRLSNGASKFAVNDTLLSEIEDTYGVDAEVIVAIWGMESSYGAILGDHDAIRALATLAWQGRRTSFGRSQLIGALKIIQNGFATREELKGSWAGAMGHTQFIPTTYLAYAVDHDGDGRRDIWGNLGDVFSSTANYLSKSGYKKDTPWGVEVTLPQDFDFSLAAPGDRRPLVAWASLGVKGVHKSLVGGYDPNVRARVIVPAGADGPAFLVFQNFEAILKYNRSTAYALGVGLLSDGVVGRPSKPIANWPREDRMLSRDERKALQSALADRGFSPGPADGVIGANTKKALRAWQKANGRAADGYASAKTLEALVSSSLAGATE